MLKIFIHFLEKAFFGKNKYIIPLIIFTLLFFFCGFITSMNDVLIPKLKFYFNLNYFESMFIQFCFFIAYFIISMMYYILSIYYNNFLLNIIGHKNIIIIGLIISSIGSLFFYPASIFKSYPLFLFALFILAAGITLLQISVNPYVTQLGDSNTASGRLNLTQAFNSLGSTIAPLIGGKLILDNNYHDLHVKNVYILPYLIVGIILVIIAIIVKKTYLPNIIQNKNYNSLYNKNKKNIYLITKYRHLKYGIIAIFMYVGGEVSINSLIIAFLLDINIVGISERYATQFLSFYWAGAMIGRFFGSIFLSNINKQNKLIGLIFILILSFLYSGMMVDFNLNIIKYFWGLIILNMIVFYILNTNIPQYILTAFSLFVIIFLLSGILSSSTIAMWSIIGIGLFNSIMFPTIFSLAIRDLYEDTSKGSSLLIMAIVGGAIIPLIQGKLADVVQNVQISYLIPIMCYSYLLFYGINGYKKNTS